jgi:hypothetical protein
LENGYKSIFSHDYFLELQDILGGALGQISPHFEAEMGHYIMADIAKLKKLIYEILQTVPTSAVQGVFSVHIPRL